MEKAELKAALTELKEEMSKAQGVELKALEDKIKALEDGAKETFKLSEDTDYVAFKQEFEAFKLSENKKTDKPATLKEQLESGKDDVKKILSGVKQEMVVKADTLRASVTDNEYSENIEGVGQLATATRAMRSICRVFPMNSNNDNGIVRYTDWDADTSARAAAIVAEGGTFPESTAKWVQYTAALEKIGDTIPMSDELVEDSQMFANELNDFLRTNVAIKENSNILTKMLAQVPAYTAVAKGIQSASINDLIVVVRNAITKPYGGKYNPNFVLMNSDLIESMDLEKDANNNYVMPPFKSADGTTIKGMRIIEENDAQLDNALIIGDSTYARLYEKIGVVISKGEVNAQFAEDLMTLKARLRELFVIRTVDRTGFLKVTDVASAITTIGTDPA